MNTIQNTVNLIGRVGIIPDVKVFDNGVKCARFSLATNETVTDEHGKTIRTQWHKIVVWGKQADLIEKYITKGDLIAIDGRIINRVFTDADGKSKKVTEIQVTEFLKITPRASQG